MTDTQNLIQAWISTLPRAHRLLLIRCWADRNWMLAGTFDACHRQFSRKARPHANTYTYESCSAIYSSQDSIPDWRWEREHRTFDSSTSARVGLFVFTDLVLSFWDIWEEQEHSKCLLIGDLVDCMTTHKY